MMEDKTIQVVLLRGSNHRLPTQRQTLEGLGLTKINRKKTLKDTPAIRGMIRKVAHLVKVVEG
jgi:large subunit ribosomal protein L30